MAIRKIRVMGDEILGKNSKPVTEITPRIEALVDDMLETMYDANGVGLAAVQVGILKKIVVIDVSPEGDSPIILLNPEIIEVSDEKQTGHEGCLSVPGKSGTVTRPMRVTVSYQDMLLRQQKIEGEALLARALCHEIDHLDGKLYVEKVEGDLLSDNIEEV